MKSLLSVPLVFILSYGLLLACFAQSVEPIKLPSPQKRGGQPLMQALQQRQTVREFKPDPLRFQALANVLWAAFGINRPATGHRTAPSAMNSQEIEIYVALPQGLYLYDPKANALKPILAEDLRSRTGGQDFARQAPVTLIYDADLSRLGTTNQDTRKFYATFDAGCICQNVYLYCASAGLATVVHDLDRRPLSNAMRLQTQQQIIFAQAVGYPKNTLPTQPRH